MQGLVHISKLNPTRLTFALFPTKVDWADLVVAFKIFTGLLDEGPSTHFLLSIHSNIREIIGQPLYQCLLDIRLNSLLPWLWLPLVKLSRSVWKRFGETFCLNSQYNIAFYRTVATKQRFPTPSIPISVYWHWPVLLNFTIFSCLSMWFLRVNCGLLTEAYFPLEWSITKIALNLWWSTNVITKVA